MEPQKEDGKEDEKEDGKVVLWFKIGIYVSPLTFPTDKIIMSRFGLTFFNVLRYSWNDSVQLISTTVTRAGAVSEFPTELHYA